MTEPGVANLRRGPPTRATATLDGDDVVLDGRKWSRSAVTHLDRAVGIFMGLTTPPPGPPST